MGGMLMFIFPFHFGSKSKNETSFSGMGREVEHLIHENTQLLETKLVVNIHLLKSCVLLYIYVMQELEKWCITPQD